MPNRANRRRFLKTTAATGIGFWLTAGLPPRIANRPTNVSASPHRRGRQGAASDSTDAGDHGDMVAICDVDEHTLEAAAERPFPRPNNTSTSARCSTKWARASTR